MEKVFEILEMEKTTRVKVILSKLKSVNILIKSPVLELQE